MELDPRVAMPFLQYRGSPAPWAGSFWGYGSRFQRDKWATRQGHRMQESTFNLKSKIGNRQSSIFNPPYPTCQPYCPKYCPLMTKLQNLPHSVLLDASYFYGAIPLYSDLSLCALRLSEAPTMPTWLSQTGESSQNTVMIDTCN
jgi:hypothetical protein